MSPAHVVQAEQRTAHQLKQGAGKTHLVLQSLRRAQTLELTEITIQRKPLHLFQRQTDLRSLTTESKEPRNTRTLREHQRTSFAEQHCVQAVACDLQGQSRLLSRLPD